MEIFDNLMGSIAKKIAGDFLAANKKLIVEFPVHKNPLQYSLANANKFTLSFPTIPARQINPWTNADFYQSFSNKPLLHLRSRDFNSIQAVRNFLTHQKIMPTIVDILVIYGDGTKSPQGLTPFEIIPHLKELGFKTGCVFNPTPVMRSPAQEQKYFIEKISTKPDFIISQCTYNENALLKFCQIVPPTIPIIVGIGFWTTCTNFIKLGINTLDEEGKEHTKPAEKFLATLLAWPKCSGIYVCDYSLKN